MAPCGSPAFFMVSSGLLLPTKDAAHGMNFDILHKKDYIHMY